MRTSLLTLSFAVVVATALGANPASIKWAGIFGAREDPAKKEAATISLMRSGFFRAPVIKDFDRLLKELLIEYPNWSAVSVAESKGWMVDTPEVIVTYVWLVAKERNLNIEMVRRGWFSGGTQFTSENQTKWKLLLPIEKDRAFIDQLKAAEEEARNHHLGIWKDISEKEEPNQAPEPTAPSGRGSS